MGGHAFLTAFFAFLNIVLSQSQRMQSTGIYKRTFFDGPGGKCEVFNSKSRKTSQLNGEIVCSQGWTKNGSFTYGKETHVRRGCKYFKKITMQLCYGTPQGKNGPVTCSKNATSYYFTAACSGYWLNWEECSAPCGGGIRSRVRITQANLRYARVTDYSSCNTHACPKWGPWEPVTSGNDTALCNITTCTRTFQRDCIYKNSTASPSLCGGELFSNDSTTNYHNTTRRDIPCGPHECDTVDGNVSTPSSLAPIGKDSTTNYHNINQKDIPCTSPECDTVDGNVSALSSLEAIERGGNKIWLGFVIGLAVTSSIFISACLIYKRFKQKTIGLSFFTSTKKNGTTNESMRTGSLHSGRSNNTAERGEFLQPETRHPIIAPPLPGHGAPVYCVVPTGRDKLPQPSLLEHNTSIIDGKKNGSIGAADPNIDPVYSHIPAFQTPKFDVSCDPYSSSEFDSCEESGGEERPSCITNSRSGREEIGPRRLEYERKDDGCKSFDSDEGRDVVHTLRKSSQKLKRIRSSEPNEEVFLTDDEVMKEDCDNVRESAFGVRYSKRSKSSKPSRNSCTMKGSQRVEGGFQWFEGRRSTSDHCDCSGHSGASQPTQRELLLENYQGHKGLSSRHSSGTSSVTSFSVDVTTSGYNSALGESTDDEHSVWNKGRSSRHSSSLRVSQYPHGRQLGRRSHHSLKTNSLLPADRRSKMTAGGPRTSSSLFNPRISRFNDADYVLNGREASILHRQPFLASRPGYNRSVSLMHGNDRCIPVEDVYSSPVDAKVEDTKVIYFEYDVPYDAINSDRIKSFTGPRRSKHLHAIDSMEN